MKWIGLNEEETFAEQISKKWFQIKDFNLLFGISFIKFSKYLGRLFNLNFFFNEFYNTDVGLSLQVNISMKINKYKR